MVKSRILQSFYFHCQAYITLSGNCQQQHVHFRKGTALNLTVFVVQEAVDESLHYDLSCKVS